MKAEALKVQADQYFSKSEFEDSRKMYSKILALLKSTIRYENKENACLNYTGMDHYADVKSLDSSL